MDRKKAIALLLLFGDSDEGDQGTSKRSCWVREQLARRHEHGEFATWFAEEKLNAGAFHAFFRMTPDRFEEILEVIAPHIQHKRTNCRDPIPVAERLAMTLRLVPISVGQTGGSRAQNNGNGLIGVTPKCQCHTYRVLV